MLNFKKNVQEHCSLRPMPLQMQFNTAQQDKINMTWVFILSILFSHFFSSLFSQNTTSLFSKFTFILKILFWLLY